MYYSDVMIELKSYLDDARMFEARSGVSYHARVFEMLLHNDIIL